MTKTEIIEELFSGSEVAPLLADGFEDAIIGIDQENDRVVYSVSKAVGVLMKEHLFTREGAMDYLDQNVFGSGSGDSAPIWVNDILFEDAGA